MAGDWIKMRSDLYRDPKVCMIADELGRPDGPLANFVNQMCQRDMTVTRNVMRNVTVGALVSVWGVLRQRGKRVGDDLVVSDATFVVVDDIADLPGFGKAMNAAGWLRESESAIEFPNFFEEYNVSPGEEQKKQNAERQKRWREKRNASNASLRNVTGNAKSNAREEKRREEETSTGTGVLKSGKDWGNSVFKNLASEDLAVSEILDDWLRFATDTQRAKCPLFAQTGGYSEANRLQVFSAAERAIEAGDHPIKLFRFIVGKSKWELITQAQEDRARARLLTLRRNGSGTH